MLASFSSSISTDVFSVCFDFNLSQSLSLYLFDALLTLSVDVCLFTVAPTALNQLSSILLSNGVLCQSDLVQLVVSKS